MTSKDVSLMVCSHPPLSYYAFACPSCREEVRKPADDHVISLLMSGGVRAQVWELPAEALEPKVGPVARLRRPARLRAAARRRRPARGAHRRPAHPLVYCERVWLAITLCIVGLGLVLLVIAALSCLAPLAEDATRRWPVRRPGQQPC